MATDALTVVVHPDLAVDCLTTDQLIELWAPGSTVTNWQDLDPSFPDQEISLFGPGTDSGTYDYMAAEVIGDESETTRDDYEASEDDNVLVQGVAGTEGATGYFGYTYYEENADELKALGIDDGNGCVLPSAETAQAGEYTPLARPLFIYVNNAKYNDNAAAKEYVDFFVANLAEIAEVGKFIPLSEELYSRDAGEPRGHQRELTRRILNATMSSITSTGAGPSSGTGLPAVPDLSRRARPGEAFIKGVLMASAYLSVAVTVGIVVALIRPVIDFFREVPFGTSSRPRAGSRCCPSSRRPAWSP